MRERLTTLALACASLLLFLMLFVHAEGPPAEDASVPTTADRQGNGLRGASAWLEEEGVRTRAVRERFSVLRRMRDLPPKGNLLIVTLPGTVPFANDEAVALDDWLRQGNTLLLLAALADRPRWAQDPGTIKSDVRLLTGFEIERLRRPRASSATTGQGAANALAEETRGLSRPRRETLLPNRAHRYFDDVRSVAGFSDYLPLHWKLKSPRDALPLCLAHIAPSADCGLSLLPDGAGSILLSAFGTLLSNRALGEAGNARLFANLVRGTLGSDGVVLFDDEHRGLSDAYDPDKFWRDRRLYLTFAILAAVWLIWVVGGTRLAAPAAAAPAQGEADLVRTTGSFLARVLRPSAAARRMFEHFFARLRRTLRERTPDPSPCWEWLEHNPRVPQADVAQLRAWYADAWSGRGVPLVRLHNLIVRTEMQIAA
ncbi:MAG TPA: DUF4350 domain-containing protein [Steroidobacteraceae bacterium]|nr:DUF4350 domain-containing protein [Steroidobacteraceae bacterium]